MDTEICFVQQMQATIGIIFSEQRRGICAAIFDEAAIALARKIKNARCSATGVGVDGMTIVTQPCRTRLRLTAWADA